MQSWARQSLPVNQDAGSMNPENENVSVIDINAW